MYNVLNKVYSSFKHNNHAKTVKFNNQKLKNKRQENNPHIYFGTKIMRQCKSQYKQCILRTGA